MRGKVCLVTGGTAGIGRATAIGLARLGACVLISGRDRQRGADTVQACKAAGAAAHFICADLASQTSVRHLAHTIAQDHPQLSILINNAGLVSKPFLLTEDGIEITFAVNHLAPFLLTTLLLPVLRARPAARIINVSSLVHQWGKIHFEDVNLTGHYDIDRAYNQSKLATILFTYELARRLEGSPVTANAVAPGQVQTGFGDAYGGLRLWLAKRLILPLFGKTPEQGADTILYLASSSAVEGTSGGYFEQRKPRRSSKATYETAAARRLWELSDHLTSTH